MTTSENKTYLRIATEEAFATKEQLALFKRVLDQPNVDKGFAHLMGFYMSSPSERAQHIMRCLVDLDELRIAHMDASGIDIQVLALTSPRAQIMDRETAVNCLGRCVAREVRLSLGGLCLPSAPTGDSPLARRWRSACLRGHAVYRC